VLTTFRIINLINETNPYTKFVESCQISKYDMQMFVYASYYILKDNIFSKFITDLFLFPEIMIPPEFGRPTDICSLEITVGLF
jgi:hypothetical protein